MINALSNKPRLDLGLILNEIESKIIAELFKNSNISNTDLAKRVGSSPTTTSKLKAKLEREGVITGYTIMPDFVKLGYKLAVITLRKFAAPLSRELIDQLTKEAGHKSPSPVIASMKGTGLGADYVSISFHKTYSEYSQYADHTKQFPQVKHEEIRSFIIDLTDTGHARSLNLSVFADYLSRKEETT